MKIFIRLFFLIIFFVSASSQFSRADEPSDQQTISEGSDALGVNRIEWLHQTCKKDLQDSGEDNEKFVVTTCGAFIQSFYYTHYLTSNFLLEEFSQALKDVPNSREIFKKVHQSPFCVKGPNSPIKTAQALISYIEEKKGEQLSLSALPLALKKKYPCEEKK